MGEKNSHPIVLVEVDAPGMELARALLERGATLISVRGIEASRRGVPAGFVGNIVHDGDEALLARVLARARPRAVIAGSEWGVELAESLAATLGLACNSPALARARRDKRAMHAAAAAAGLAVPRQISVDSVSAALEWRARLGLTDVVVKPAASAGSDQVSACASDEVLARAVTDILGSRSRLGSDNHVALIQERLTGTELYVNAVSHDGRHRISDIWRGTRRVLPHADFGYDDYRLLASSDEDARVARPFVEAVLDALGVRTGMSHTEIMLTANGPTLIESAARLDGLALHALQRACMRRGQIDLMVDLTLDPATFAAAIDTPHERVTRAICAAVACDRHGVVCEDRALERLRELPTFFAWRPWSHIGAHVEPTRDIFGVHGFAWLVASEPSALDIDRGALRRLERDDGLFTIAEPFRDEPARRGPRGFATRDDLRTSPLHARALAGCGWSTRPLAEATVSYAVSDDDPDVVEFAKIQRPRTLDVVALAKLQDSLGVDSIYLDPAVDCSVVAPGREPFSLELAEDPRASLHRAPERYAVTRTLVFDAFDPGFGPAVERHLALSRSRGERSGRSSLRDVLARAEREGDTTNPFFASLGELVAEQDGFCVTVELSARRVARAFVVVWQGVANVIYREGNPDLASACALVADVLAAARERGAALLDLGGISDSRFGERGDVWSELGALFGAHVVDYPPPRRFRAPRPSPPPAPALRAAAIGAVAHEPGDRDSSAVLIPHLRQSPDFAAGLERCGFEIARVGGQLVRIETLDDGRRRGVIDFATRIDAYALRAARHALALDELFVEPEHRVILEGHPAPLTFDATRPEAFVLALEAVGLAPSRVRHQPRKTRIVDLRRDFSSVIADFARGTRHDLGTAKRRGLASASRSSWSLCAPDYGELEVLYRDWLAEHPGSPDEWAVIAAIVQATATAGFTTEVRHEGLLLGAMHTIVCDRVATAYAMYARRAGAWYKAGVTLWAESMRQAQITRADYYDFGGSWDERFPDEREGWRGFTAFKARLGGRPRYYPPSFEV